jgi:hypothetical protein
VTRHNSDGLSRRWHRPASKTETINETTQPREPRVACHQHGTAFWGFLPRAGWQATPRMPAAIIGRSCTHGGPCCQGARWPDLVTCGCGRRAGMTAVVAFPCRCRFVPSRGPGSSWSARSRVTARTNELDAGKRRPMIGSEEKLSGIWGCRGRAGWVVAPGCAGWRSGLTCTHPAPRWTAGCHDHDIRGPGCSVRSSSAAGGPAHAKTRAHPGPGDPSGLVGVPPLAASASRW